MTKKRFVIGSFLLSFLVGICTPSCLLAQSFGQQDELLSGKHLQRAIQLIEYNKNDSALTYLEPVWEQLTAQGLTESPFGMKVQLARVRALEQKHRHSEAILLFNELKAKSEANQEWNIYAGTCLSLAKFYEKMHRQQRSKEHLDLADIAIAQHQLDSLYPSLIIRRAMWNINFGQHPDSIQYYSQKAISVVNDSVTDSPILRYSLFLVQGMAVYQRNYLEAIEWYKKAVAIAKDLNDPVRMSESWNMIARSYKDFEKDLGKALAYNDSTIMACYQAIAVGHERIFTLHNAYWLRSKFYYSAGQLDSAYYFLDKGLSQEIAYVKQQQFDRVAEVDARYQDDQKTKQLEDQARAIAYEQRIRNLLLAIFAVTLLLAVGLTIGLVSYRKAMRKLTDQNKIIQQQAEKLKSLDAAKSRFFANVSHELRTPLTLVLGPIKTALKSGTLDNRNFTLLTMARQNVQSLLELVGSILNLSKIEHGKLTLNEKPEILFPLLRRLVSTFESHAQREGIELTFDYQAEVGLQLQLDQLKLKNILNNLLSNAIKFTPSGGKIKVTTKDKGNAILLSVQDTGRGITAKDLPHVFDRFYQSEEENAPTEGGTGIGLAFCKELATIMGGKIWAESQSGAGSTFYVELPRKEVLGVPLETGEEIPDEQPAITTGLPVNGKAHKVDEQALADGLRPTIMVVEDNYSLRDYLTTILEPHYNVVTASHGKDALNQLNGNSDANSPTVCDPALIISDVMMPVMDGFQLMEKLKVDDRYNRLPLIMLTARADIRDKLKALRIGVDDYLLKPFDEEELLVRIENLLANQSVRKEIAQEAKAPTDTPSLSLPDQEWLENFESYVEKNLSNDALTVSFLAHEFAMSDSSLFRQVSRLTGLSPKQYIQEVRLDAARQLLENRSYRSVSRVATETGYSNARTFTRNFKERFGKSPSEYLSD